MDQSIIVVTKAEAERIIETRNPRGLFLLHADGRFVGIDNLTGHAWTEDFDCQATCAAWLRGTGTKEDYEGVEGISVAPPNHQPFSPVDDDLPY